VTLNPSATPAYDEALAADLGDRPSGFVHRGAEIGAHVAKDILAWRQHDGWVVSAFPPYAEPPLPGRWQPTPPANAAATFTHLQQAAPMALLSATQVLPPPPPSLTSARYAADLNEVKLIGKSDSAVRTDEQTTISRLWSGVGTTTGFFSVWNNMARDVVLARRLSLVRNRPRIRARQRGDPRCPADNASEQVCVRRVASGDRDPRGGHGSESRYRSRFDLAALDRHAAVSRLCRQSGDDRSQRGARPPAPLRHGRRASGITWSLPGGTGVTRLFDGFWQAAEEEAMARIWGGIHYRFDQQAGQQVGLSVAEFVFANFVRPRARGFD
jgi:hypothetical protein